MEAALSPRSTNLMIKPKVAIERKVLDKNAAAAAAAATASAQKSASAKNHAPPPPSIVTEPGEDGEKYATGAFLGKGGFAVCYEGTLARNARVFAMKVVKSEMPQKKMEEKFRTELQIHSKMRHPHIVQFHRAFAFEQNTYVVLELCPNGSVMEMVRRRKCLSLPEVRRFMVQLCGAVKYLHKRNVAHRDLKMGNLFLDQHMDIKVGDFGLAAIILSERDEKRRKTLCGTPNYIAPEVLDRSKGGHTQKVDIWSLGVICFAMLTGYPPFQSKTQEEIYKKVRNLTYVWPKDTDCPNHIPEEAKSLVSSCLNLAEDERPDPDDIVEHPFFNMYTSCIPRQLEPSCRLSKPLWLKADEPRGDRMIAGYSLEFDEKYRAIGDAAQSTASIYRQCRDAFYASCGVGRRPDGSAVKATGKNCSKSAYAECLAEDERGLQPVIPLSREYVYAYPHDNENDWSLPETSSIARSDSVSESSSSIMSGKRSISLRNNTASLNRTQVALAAAQQRRKESQSHAATLRQQAMPGRSSVRKLAALCDPPQVSAVNPLTEIQEKALETAVPPTQALGGFAERPIRVRRGVAASYSGSLRDLDRNAAPQMAKSSSVPSMLKVGKTRSQSRMLEAASQEQQPSSQFSTQDRLPSSTTMKDPVGAIRASSMRTVSRKKSKDLQEKTEEQPRSVKREEIADDHRRPQAPAASQQSGLTRTNSKVKPSESRARSSICTSPLFHDDDRCEMLPGTSLDDVNNDLRLMLTNMIPVTPSRRRSGSRRAPHRYVIKWVDYTNRYGIGYVLDDGSVGCVFKGENGRPASCIVVRDGEKHIRRKVRSQEREKEGDYYYSEADQLVPRTGKPIEFYENCDEANIECRGIRRAFISPAMFEVKVSANGARFRTNPNPEGARSDAEKIKRVKLADQFGKYMIGSLGRHDDDEGPEKSNPAEPNGQFIKFYQRLGNVGIWGFGDGAFQFNFPDHTKLVITPGRTRSSSPWIDFYHLSPSAARYLTTKGKMHPSGFDTRAIASEEAVTFISIAQTTPTNSTEERIRDILDANSFLQKVQFLREVLKGWVKHGRLGGRPQPAPLNDNNHRPVFPELYWEGTQERPHPGGSGGKFVWVTVGAPGGDGEYISVSLKEGDNRRKETDGDGEVDALRERLRGLGA
ncbi:hypothetical protein ASPZODRAFT_2061945 [Penicilliopsis zonata CBS 506.65]|uniref:Protein kinase domain-containing protein n=1 Tax=Penicilliopsis zonata CBS 506.65 TaxID=1073090 RepID=A0A1L9SGC3_9EURO|nr:hypothetical protein ASPZODRAFT_2061945 [Penicilliopsis zonata CBS 506.65]OJJ46137.1 hypothetical protein ASPZODRAFT_2061945 [Penicilliopsis zonata CBS 506.65]